MIFNFGRKKAKRKRFMRTWSRELIGLTLDLESDVDIDGEEVLDFVSDQLQMEVKFADIAAALCNQYESAGVKSTAVIVHDRTWQIVLSQDPNYELEF